ncbi:MAG: hypothetical protein LBB84_00180 [Tannerellaceae bacterium]|jgi:hypothetical protein|nr:hypothetical protein [Tannerellaceae bacterium]
MKNLLAGSLLLLSTAFAPALNAGHYEGFKVSVYITANDVNKMTNTKWLDSTWTEISSRLKVDKVYIESHRDGRYTSEAALLAAKKFFASKKVAFGGGITYTPESHTGRWETFCYTTPEGRAEVKKIAEYTAKHFDEILLDDFFFNSCKCEHCTAAKGSKSWTEYRVELMRDAARNLVAGPARAVNPQCKVIIKYPNWYEHFPALGFDLDIEPAIFDGVWSGTESRNPNADQHLQAYLSYEIVRYLDNISNGKNGGGWIDAGGMTYADRYAEQAWMTLLGKAPECTLFEFGSLQRPIGENLKGAWQGTGTSFDWNKLDNKPTLASIASVAFRELEKVYNKLGKPIGIASYKPANSVGEDNLQNFFGMMGLPIEMTHEFPENAEVVLLTEQAAYDKFLVDKIRKQLKAGREVIVTSGLAKKIGKELDDIVELRIGDGKGFVNDFSYFGKSKEKMIIPQVLYYTNDAWEDIPAHDKGVLGWPLLLQARYENGSLWVWTIPDSFADLYELPEGALNRLRAVAGADVPVRIEGPANISLFAYDNNTFVVESFLDKPVKVKLIIDEPAKQITDMISGNKISPEANPPAGPRAFPFFMQARIWLREPKTTQTFEVEIKPHSFRAFKQN